MAVARAPQRCLLALDLPAGDYVLRVGTDAGPSGVEAGRTTVLRLHTQLITGATVFELGAEAWWRECLASSRTRHGFLAAPPERGAHGMLTWSGRNPPRSPWPAVSI